MSFEKRITTLIENEFPDFLREEYPKFVAFLRAYYEWLEQEKNPLYYINLHRENVDIDETLDEFLEVFRKKYLEGIPKNSLVDERRFVKYAKDFFSSKGTENSFRFLFLALFNKEIDFYFPKKDILKVSDGNWVVEEVIFVESVGEFDPFDFERKIIVGEDSEATGFVQTIRKTNEGDRVIFEMILSDTQGTFLPEENIKLNDGSSSTIAQVQGFVESIDVTKGGLDYEVGQPVPIISSPNGGINAFTRISKVKNPGFVTGFDIKDGGQNYLVGDKVNILSDSGFGALAEVSEVSGGTQITKDITIIADVQNVVLDTVKNIKIEDYIDFQTFELGAISKVNLIEKGRNYERKSLTEIELQDPRYGLPEGTGADIVARSDSTGEVEEIEVVEPGVGYIESGTFPKADLTNIGNQLALADVNVSGGPLKKSGYFLNNDGHISSNKFIHDGNFYQEYSYVIKVEETLEKYRKIIKDVLHPAGMKLFSRFEISAKPVNEKLLTTATSHPRINITSKESYEMNGIFVPTSGDLLITSAAFFKPFYVIDDFKREKIDWYDQIILNNWYGITNEKTKYSRSSYLEERATDEQPEMFSAAGGSMKSSVGGTMFSVATEGSQTATGKIIDSYSNNIVSYVDFTDNSKYTLASGNVVSSVDSVNGKNFEAVNSPEYDSSLFGGHGGAVLKAVDDYFRYDSTFTTQQNQTIAMVIDLPESDPTDPNRIFSFADGNSFGWGDANLYQAPDKTGVLRYDGDSGFPDVVDVGDNGIMIVVMRFNSNSDCEVFSYKFSQKSQFNPDDRYSVTSNVSKIWLGDQNISPAGLAFAEFLHVNEAITDNEISDLFDYWSERYYYSPRKLQFAKDLISGEDVRALQTFDINQNGRTDLLSCNIGNTNPNSVYWLENNGTLNNFERHFIATSVDVNEPEDVNAFDFDEDGKIEVVVSEQDAGRISIFKQDTNDPEGNWSKYVIQENVPKLQSTYIHDINDDGNMDILYAYEGNSSIGGGVAWLQFIGGDPTDAGNWINRKVLDLDGAWWIEQSGPKDYGNDGVENEFLISVREDANPNAIAELCYITPGNDPANSWSKTTITNTRDPLIVSTGNFFGDTKGRDIVISDFDSTVGGLFLYDFSNDYAETILDDNFNYGFAKGIDIGLERDLIVSHIQEKSILKMYVFDESINSYRLSDKIFSNEPGGTRKINDRAIFEKLNERTYLILPDGNEPIGTENGSLKLYLIR